MMDYFYLFFLTSSIFITSKIARNSFMHVKPFDAKNLQVTILSLFHKYCFYILK